MYWKTFALLLSLCASFQDAHANNSNTRNLQFQDEDATQHANNNQNEEVADPWKYDNGLTSNTTIDTIIKETLSITVETWMEHAGGLAAFINDKDTQDTIQAAFDKQDMLLHANVTIEDVTSDILGTIYLV